VLLHADHDFVELPQDHSLCLYRVTQEALRNTATHANASRADVRLYRSDNDAELAVVDDGRGFDVANAARPSGGLGLLSIHERVRLAGGTVSIVSGLHQGTTVRVRIPIAKAC
jgi:signal transduction histidine kinase